MAKRLAAVGDLVVDIVLEARLPLAANLHQTANSLQFEAGGAGTTILAARKLGLDVAALGALGDDLQGRMLLDILHEANVDAAALEIPVGSSTTTVIALSDPARGEHVFLGHYGEGADIDFTDLAQARLAAADAIFIPGYTLAEARLSGLVQGAFDWLAANERRLYFDVGPFAPQASQTQIELALSLCHTLLLTADEIPFVASGERGLDACRQLLQQYPHLTIALKLGAAGCRILSGEREVLCPGVAVAVVDEIGAGDAFAAAYIWADLNGFSARECGTIANAMGAASVARRGAGSNAPSRAEVQTLLDQGNTGIILSC